MRIDPVHDLRALVLLVLLAGSSQACLGPEGAAGEAVRYDACAPAALVPAAPISPAEGDSLAAAAALWNGLGVTRLSAPDARSDAPSPAGAAVQAIPVVFREASLIFLGAYAPETGEIYVNRAIEAAQARTLTIAHELGHAFGLPHVARELRASVMNPANLEVAPNAEDAAALRALFPACLGAWAR